MLALESDPVGIGDELYLLLAVLGQISWLAQVHHP